MPAINTWTKARPMVRASVDANARNAIACFTPATPGQNQYSPQIRDTTGSASTSSDVAANPLGQDLQPGVAARPTVGSIPVYGSNAWGM